MSNISKGFLFRCFFHKSLFTLPTRIVQISSFCHCIFGRFPSLSLSLSSVQIAYFKQMFTYMSNLKHLQTATYVKQRIQSQPSLTLRHWFVCLWLLSYSRQSYMFLNNPRCYQRGFRHGTVWDHNDFPSLLWRTVVSQLMYRLSLKPYSINLMTTTSMA